MNPCKTCRFWNDAYCRNRCGSCRRRSPSTDLIVTVPGLDPAPDPVWPHTDDTDWCGDWEAKDAPVEEAK